MKPFWPRHRLNPERPTVWFVGITDDAEYEIIELELQPEGLPYMIPAWWSVTHGPYTKGDAEAVLRRLKTRGIAGTVSSSPGQTEERMATPPSERAARIARSSSEPPPATRTGQTLSVAVGASLRDTLARLRDAGMQWRCANEVGADVRSYVDAQHLLARVQGRHRMMGYRIHARITCVKLGQATWLLDPNRALRNEETAGALLIQYHRTIILIYHRDGRVTLNTGGWTTPTTKTRINQFLPYAWALSTIRSRAAYARDFPHTRSGFSGREFTGSYWAVFRRGPVQRPWEVHAVYEDGLTLPPT